MVTCSKITKVKKAVAGVAEKAISLYWQIKRRMLAQLKHNNLKIVGELYIFANCLLHRGRFLLKLEPNRQPRNKLRQSSQNLKSFQQNVHNSNINAICPPKSLKIDRRLILSPMSANFGTVSSWSLLPIGILLNRGEGLFLMWWKLGQCSSY